MSAAPPIRSAGRKPAAAGLIPARRIVRIQSIAESRRLRLAGRAFLRPAATTATRPASRTRTDREKIVARLWIGLLLAIWLVLMAYAGRDGIKPQDPATAASFVRK